MSVLSMQIGSTWHVCSRCLTHESHGHSSAVKHISHLASSRHEAVTSSCLRLFRIVRNGIPGKIGKTCQPGGLNHEPPLGFKRFTALAIFEWNDVASWAQANYRSWNRSKARKYSSLAVVTSESLAKLGYLDMPQNVVIKCAQKKTRTPKEIKSYQKYARFLYFSRSWASAFFRHRSL